MSSQTAILTRISASGRGVSRKSRIQDFRPLRPAPPFRLAKTGAGVRVKHQRRLPALTRRNTANGFPIPPVKPNAVACAGSLEKGCGHLRGLMMRKRKKTVDDGPLKVMPPMAFGTPWALVRARFFQSDGWQRQRGCPHAGFFFFPPAHRPAGRGYFNRSQRWANPRPARTKTNKRPQIFLPFASLPRRKKKPRNGVNPPFVFFGGGPA